MTAADDIKARLDIVDVVADRVPDLKRTGRNYHARCPFHQERTPSFVVFPDRQTWRCFGACATGGDVFSFVMKAEGLDFSAALRLLADRAGVQLEQRRAAERAENPLYAVNDAAQQIFRDAFIAERGAQARAYAAARSLSDEAIARFGIGYAPSTGEELLRRLTALGFHQDLIFRAGLAIGGDPDGGPARDMFRGRLMFPLRDVDGRIAGFAGRSLDGSDPKYINTPQTPVFDKGRMLYALDRAKEPIGAERVAVVVEGYMDVIAAHEHGVRNVVASMGTALTAEQIALLKARASRIILALDADAAGQEATLRSLRNSWPVLGDPVPGARRTEILNRPGDLDLLRVALITGGKDPDELIRADVDQFRRMLADAVPAFEFLIRAETARVDLTTAEGRTEALRRLLPALFLIKDFSEQAHYSQRVADAIGAPIDVVDSAAKQYAAQQQAARPRRQQSSEPDIAIATGDPLEDRVLALLAGYPEYWSQAASVEAEHFRSSENRAILSAVQTSATMEDALAQLDGQLADRLVRLSQEALPPADRQQRAAEWQACLRRLKERHLRELKAQEVAIFAEDAAKGDPNDPKHLEAVSRNRQLQDVFVSGPS